MKYSLAIFDLDGTLTDSQEGIIKTFLFVCDSYKIEKKAEDLYKYIGPPIFEIFRDILQVDDREKIAEAVRLFRSRYENTGCFENKVYDGVCEMLQRLKAGGIKLAVATSKPDLYANKILANFKLDKYFDFICGATMDGKIAEKPELISCVTDKFKNEKAVMIGDRFYDLKGAEAVGLDAIGARYGYAPDGELEECKHVFLADTPCDIADFILG